MTMKEIRQKEIRQKEIRQSIVTIVGHIDHGKTTLLDSIRKTAIAKKEAGGITQKISSTLIPSSLLEEKCSALLEKYKIKLEIPGFLFIDTPGHAAFTNLRKRGGALADLAILVIDINEGIMPQTVECIEILKNNKTPFVVALNKIDAIAGWSRRDDDLLANIKKQASYVKEDFEKKLYKIVNSLVNYKFDANIFSAIEDFTKQIALIPCSGKTGEGIAELLVMLAGLSQRFLKGKLFLSKEARGVVLEIKKEKTITFVDSILYDGTIRQNEQIVIASLARPIETKIRALFEALPLAKGFQSVKEVKAATGIRLSLPTTANVIPGMPFASATISNIKTDLQKEVADTIKLDKEGIIIKADSLGSLEALLGLLRKKGIKVGKAGIGNINKGDIASAAANPPLEALILGFNVQTEPGVEAKKAKIISSKVIYELIEKFELWRKEKQVEIEREKLSGMVFPFKIKVLPYIFRKNKPAIFGVHVEAGILKAIQLMNSKGKSIDKIKAIQLENKTVEKAARGEDVAISMPNITIGRQVKKDDILYSDLNEENFALLKENKNLLTSDELAVLQEIVRIKRKKNPTWGI